MSFLGCALFLSSPSQTARTCPWQPAHSPPAEEPKARVRLTGGSNPRRGRVEVWNKGMWGHVGQLSNVAATLVCQELFGAEMLGVASSQPFFLPDLPVALRGAVWRDRDGCTPGQHSSFLACANEPTQTLWNNWWWGFNYHTWTTDNPLFQVACFERSGEIWCHPAPVHGV